MGSQRAGHDLETEQQVFKSKSATFQHPSLPFLFCSVFVVAVYIVAICQPNRCWKKKILKMCIQENAQMSQLVLSFYFYLNIYCILPFVMLNCPSAFLFTRLPIHQGWNGSHMSLYCNHLAHHFIYRRYANYFLWRRVNTLETRQYVEILWRQFAIITALEKLDLTTVFRISEKNKILESIDPLQTHW